MTMKKSNLLGEPYNGFLLSNPRFGLTIEDFRSFIRLDLDPATAAKLAGNNMTWDIEFLPSEEVALMPSFSLPPVFNSERDVETLLASLKPALLKLTKLHNLGSLQLARLDKSLNVQRREEDAGPGAGWSQVAAKGARPGVKTSSGVSGMGSRFAVLALKGKGKDGGKEGKGRRESVVEDWEVEEERVEREAGGHGGVKDWSAEQSGEEVTGKDGGENEFKVEAEVGGPAVGEASAAVTTPTTPSLGRWAELDDEEWEFQG
jgi:transcriptional repressor NF-X1